jgi:hypothetical protein
VIWKTYAKEKGIQRRAAQNRANGDQIQVECGELGEWKLMDDADVSGQAGQARSRRRSNFFIF